MKVSGKEVIITSVVLSILVFAVSGIIFSILPLYAAIKAFSISLFGAFLMGGLVLVLSGLGKDKPQTGMVWVETDENIDFKE